MPIIKAQRVPKKKQKPEDIIALFCCRFPAYKYHEAKKMPFMRVKQLMETYERENARKMLSLLEIVTAPHTEKGKGVKNLIDKYKEILG